MLDTTAQTSANEASVVESEGASPGVEPWTPAAPCEGHNCEHPWSGPEPRYWGAPSYGDQSNLRKAGLGLLVTGGGLAVGSLLAGTVNMCNRDGAMPTNCSKDTRVNLAIGFGVASTALIAGGATMLGLAKRRRAVQIGMSTHTRGASVSLSARF